MVFLRKLLAKSYVYQMKAIGGIFNKINNVNFKAAGAALTDPECIALAHEMMYNMTLLPAVPGSKRFDHNMQYTIPFFISLDKKKREYLKKYTQQNFVCDWPIRSAVNLPN